MNTLTVPAKLVADLKAYLELQPFSEVFAHAKHFEAEVAQDKQMLISDMQKVANYLVQKPYAQVAYLIKEITSLPADAVAPVPQTPEQTEPVVGQPMPAPVAPVPEIPTSITPEVVNPPSEEMPLAAQASNS